MSRRGGFGTGRGRGRGRGGGGGSGRINLAKKLAVVVELAPTEGSDVSSLSDFSSGALENIDLTNESTFMKVHP